MKTLYMMPVLAAMLAAGPVLAQDMPKDITPPDKLQRGQDGAPAARQPADDAPARMGNDVGADLPGGQAAEIPTENLLGRSVVGLDGAELGEVSGMVFDAGGGLSGVMVESGGFLGIGAKKVAVDLRHFGGAEKLAGAAANPNGDPIVIQLTKIEFDTLPEFLGETENGNATEPATGNPGGAAR